MITIADVAKCAGVSTITVSRVLNHSGPVKTETRQRVEAAIETLAYVPNANARSLASGRSHSIALIVSPLTHPYWIQVVSAIQTFFSDRDIACLLGHARFSAQEEHKQIAIALQQRVEGIILFPSAIHPPAIAELRDRQVPLVLISAHHQQEADNVLADMAGGAALLTEHLLSLGHRRIALLNSSRRRPMMYSRYEGYRQALLQQGIALDETLVRWLGGSSSRIRAANATEALLDLPERPSAILAATPHYALGAISALNDRGLRIPEDMALVAMNELPALSSFMTLALLPSPQQLGKRAAEMLLARIQGEKGDPREYIASCTLRVRTSSGGPLLTPVLGEAVQA